MIIRYQVTVDRQGDQWRAVCPTLRDHGAVTGGEAREEAMIHIENVISMILAEMDSGGVRHRPTNWCPATSC